MTGGRHRLRLCQELSKVWLYPLIFKHYRVLNSCTVTNVIAGKLVLASCQAIVTNPPVPGSEGVAILVKQHKMSVGAADDVIAHIRRLALKSTVEDHHFHAPEACVLTRVTANISWTGSIVGDSVADYVSTVADLMPDATPAIVPNGIAFVERITTRLVAPKTNAGVVTNAVIAPDGIASHRNFAATSFKTSVVVCAALRVANAALFAVMTRVVVPMNIVILNQ